MSVFDGQPVQRYALPTAHTSRADRAVMLRIREYDCVVGLGLETTRQEGSQASGRPALPEAQSMASSVDSAATATWPGVVWTILPSASSDYAAAGGWRQLPACCLQGYVKVDADDVFGRWPCTSRSMAFPRSTLSLPTMSGMRSGWMSCVVFMGSCMVVCSFGCMSVG
jgi:hypothetical protein